MAVRRGRVCPGCSDVTKSRASPVLHRDPCHSVLARLATQYLGHLIDERTSGPAPPEGTATSTESPTGCEKKNGTLWPCSFSSTPVFLHGFSSFDDHRPRVSARSSSLVHSINHPSRLHRHPPYRQASEFSAQHRASAGASPKSAKHSTNTEAVRRCWQGAAWLIFFQFASKRPACTGDTAEWVFVQQRRRNKQLALRPQFYRSPALTR